MTENDNSKMIGQRIKSIRKKKKLTLEEFGKLFSPIADKAVVSNWENGKNLPNADRIKRITEIGEVSELYIMTGVDSSIIDSMHFLSEVAIDALEHSTTDEVNHLIKSFATYLSAVSRIEKPEIKDIAFNIIPLNQYLLTGKAGSNELSPEKIFELRSTINISLDKVIKDHLT